MRGLKMFLNLTTKKWNAEMLVMDMALRGTVTALEAFVRLVIR
jgi:hypothetical protein